MPLPRGKFPMPVRQRRYPIGKFNEKRTLEFLNRGTLHLKTSVKVITIAYNIGDIPSAGLREFIKEKVPQIQYKNPNVQILAFKNQYKFPSLRIYHEDYHRTMIDCENKESDRIFQELSKVAGKSKSVLMEEKAQASCVINPANFGNIRTGRFCICEIPGQVPCPAVTPLTNVQHSWKDKS